MQTIHIQLPTSFFKSYKKACTRFIWKSNTPRISYSRLTCPKSRWGIGLPDMIKYYLACHLNRVVDWKAHRHNKVWVILESFFSGTSIHTLPWLKPSFWPQSIKEHPLTYPPINGL